MRLKNAHPTLGLAQIDTIALLLMPFGDQWQFNRRELPCHGVGICVLTLSGLELAQIG